VDSPNARAIQARGADKEAQISSIKNIPEKSSIDCIGL
jgi:hypothetical protein